MTPSPSRSKPRLRFLAGPPRRPTRFGETPFFREGLYRLGRHCHAWMVPNGSWGESNLGLVACGRGEGAASVMIDTCWDVSHTREVLDGLGDLIVDAPIAHVVNSHADGDHWWGNQLLADRHIIATDACRRQMDETTPGTLRALGAATRLTRHAPGLGGVSRYLGTMFSPYDFSEVTPTHPDETFSGRHSLRVNGVDIDLIELGPAHTRGDCAVFVPDDRVVYAADLLFVGSTPVAWAGPVDNVVGGLRRLLDLEADIFVPGHGALASRRHVQQTIDYWEYLQETLYRDMRAGAGPEAAARRVARSRDFGQRPFANWDSPERIIANAVTLYRDWGVAGRELPHPLAALNVMRQQANLAARQPRALPGCMHGRALRG